MGADEDREGPGNHALGNMGQNGTEVGGMGSFKCTCLLRTAREVEQWQEQKLPEGPEGYQSSEEWWDQCLGGKAGQGGGPGIWWWWFPRGICRFWEAKQRSQKLWREEGKRWSQGLPRMGVTIGQITDFWLGPWRVNPRSRVNWNYSNLPRN